MADTGSTARDASYVATVLAGLAACLGGLAYANFKLSPYTYDESAWSAVATSCLQQGRHFRFRDINSNYRLLRRAEIAAMREAPEVAVTGASHIQHVSDAALPGHTMHNFYVHQPRASATSMTIDSFADALAIPELLYRAGKLPKTYVMALQINHFSLPAKKEELNPHQRHGGDHLRDDWRQLSSEYRSMTRRLGLPEPNVVESFPKEFALSLLSATQLQRSIGLRVRFPQGDQCTDETRGELGVLHPDGSLTKAAKHRELETLAYAHKLAIETAEIERPYRIKIDPPAVEAIGRLLDFLKAHDVHVVMLLTPHHPLYFAGIEGTQYRKDIEAVEAEAHVVAQQHGVDLAGSFDPAKVECDETEYYDFIHITESCAARILQKVPALAPRIEPGAPKVAVGRYEATVIERGPLDAKTGTAAVGNGGR